MSEVTVSTYHVWLDDVRPSPYADQLSLGFRWLRFSRVLEREYRAHMLEDSFELKRIALSVATLIWLTLALLDMALVGQPHLGWVLAVRGAVLVILLVCAALILQRRHPHLLLPLSMVCILALGIGAAVIVGIAHDADPSYPYEGLLLVSMAAYFLVGLRLGEALACSLVVLLAYVLAEWLAGLPASRLINNVLFLAFGNLTGAVGCYLLEYKSREHFLVSRLMRLLADHDSLTGLHNRRSFNRQFERLWRQAQRNDQAIALLLCDIDHFKAYNDCYGHQAGDRALQRVGAMIEQAARRPLDMGVRLGERSSPCCCSISPPRKPYVWPTHCGETLERAGIPHRGCDGAGVLTMSVGVACLTPGTQGELSQLYEQADRALYEAKAFGRNRVAT